MYEEDTPLVPGRYEKPFTLRISKNLHAEAGEACATIAGVKNHSTRSRCQKLGAFLFASLLPVLAACGGNAVDPPKSGPQYSQEEFRSAAGAFAGDAATLAEAAARNRGALVLGSFPLDASFEAAAFHTTTLFTLLHTPQKGVRLFDPNGYGTLNHLEGELPRGTFVYNEAGEAWEGGANATGDLVFRWVYRDTKGNHDAELTVDWDVAGETIFIENGPEVLEVPTSMNVRLRADETTLADVDAAIGWFSGTYCGGTVIFYDPSSLSASGFIGDDANRLEFDVSAGARDNDEAGADILSSKGLVSLSAGADEASVNWDVSAAGTLVELDNEEGCLLRFDTDSGSVSLGSAVKTGSEKEGFNLSFDFSNIGQNMSAVTLQNGAVALGGETALLFSGRFDDANKNGVPGENLTLTFEGEQTTTLEALIGDIIKEVAASSVSKLSSLLR